MRDEVIKMRRGGKKTDRQATRRVSRLVVADSHPVNVPRTPKRLNGVTRLPAVSLVRSLARVVHHANLSIPVSLRFAFSNDPACL